ncbi:MAG: translocation/assembly module TamB domain-containing protein [Dysgonamonadaceae bacterium]|nr:translocation/assembly module TamB domain-containing protein [Dysgonamonadaceae bacterium]
MLLNFYCSIKKLVRILLALTAAPAVLILLVYLLLWLPPVQRKIKDVALKEIMKKTHNRLSIDDLYLRPFNRLQLKGVYVGDFHGDTLLYAGKVSAGFDLFRLLDKQLAIKSVDLDNFVIHVEKDRLNGDFNFQFLIDAFPSEPPDTTSSSIAIQIRDIRLKKGLVTYNVLSEPVLPDSLFDVNHICLSSIYSEIDLYSPNTENRAVRIHSLSFGEKSGLDVKHLQATIQLTGEKYSVSDVKLRLPHSYLAIPDGYYDSNAFSLTWDPAKIHLPELKMFYPALADFPEDLTFSGEIKGKLPEIELSRFQADYGKRAHLQLQGSIADYGHWQDTPIQLLLKSSSVDACLVEKLLHWISKDSRQQLAVRPGAVTLNGRVQGALPDLKANLTLGSDCGAIQLEGVGGYDFHTKETRFDVFMESGSWNVGEFLQDTLYGRADLQLQTKGKIPISGPMNISANARIDRFDFYGYSYSRIWANAAYRGDSIRLNVYCDDHNLPIEINAYADMSKKKPSLTLSADLKCAYLDTLHWLPDYKNAFLIGRIRADVRGFDPEKMKATLCIDSLALTTDKGSFREPHFRLAYTANDKGMKELNISSHVVNARAKGNFTYAGLQETAGETLPMLFPKGRLNPKKNDRVAENFDFRVGMNHVNSVSDLLELPRQVPDSAFIMGKYSNDGQNLKFSASAYTRFLESDTLQLSLVLSNKADRLAVVFNVDNKSANYDVDGSIDAEIEFIPKKGRWIPDMNILFNPTVFVLNETPFDFNPSRVEIREGRYAFYNLLLDYAENTGEYIRVNGVVSTSEADSLTLDISRFRLSTLFGAVKTDVPLSGIVNGRVTARSLLSTPFVLTRDFAVNQIFFDGNAVGDLKVNCGWNSLHKGLALNVTCGQAGRPPSTLTGFILPEKDSLHLKAAIRDVELRWFQKMMAENLYGLAGSVGADVTISGKLSDPVIRGIVRANQAKIGIGLLNTLYSINDSIAFGPKAIELKKFTVLDENQQTLTATGTVTHRRFSGFVPDIHLTLNDFLVLNNERQVDGLFYGNMRVNGLLTVKQSNRDWLISGDITHSNPARFTVNLPSTASTAARYNSMITYTNAEPAEASPAPRRTRSKDENNAIGLPLKISTSLWFDPGLTIGAKFNPATGDAAYVNGNGMIKLTYDGKTSGMSLLGDYEIASGSAGLSLANIARKTFAVQEGGKLIFHGDPLKTAFNLTALYNLRADLRTLDPGFGTIGIVNTKVPVSCSLTAVGSIDRMILEYDIMLPAESNDIQRKVDGLLYTDDMKIKQIAYLVALGSFMPASGDSPTLGSPNLINSLASLTSGGLNRLLSGVLSDKWSIGTDINGLDNVSVNVSGSMLDNRLTVNGTVGYHGNTGLTNNFTGDFTVEYKLAPSGHLVLKAYNVTNNQYYEQAPTTQGLGLAYKREARTFRKLFDKFRKKNEETER